MLNKIQHVILCEISVTKYYVKHADHKMIIKELERFFSVELFIILFDWYFIVF